MEKRRQCYIKNKLRKKQLFKYYKKVKICRGGLRDIQIRGKDNWSTWQQDTRQGEESQRQGDWVSSQKKSFKREEDWKQVSVISESLKGFKADRRPGNWENQGNETKERQDMRGEYENNTKDKWHWNQSEQIAQENKQPETKEWRKEEIKNKKLRGEKGMRAGELITHKKHRWRKGGGQRRG